MATAKSDELVPINTVSVLHFHKDPYDLNNYMLDTSFHPYTESLEMVYETTVNSASSYETTMNHPLQISDTSNICPGCTKPQESSSTCHD